MHSSHLQVPMVWNDLEFILGCYTSVLHIANSKICDEYPLDAQGVTKSKAKFLILNKEG